MSKHVKKGKGPRRSQGGLTQSLDDKSLSQLTSKIEQNLNGNDQKRKKPPTNASSKNERKRRRAEDGPSDLSSSGNLGALLAEIKALGGDEKDLELIGDVESADETYAEDDKRTVDKKLKAEIAALSKELGFAEIEPDAASEVDEGSASDRQDEQNGGDDDEADEEEPGDADTQRLDADVRRKAGNLKFEPRADWHASKLRKLPEPTTTQLGSFTSVINDMKQYARTLLDEDSHKYRTSVFASSSHKFLSTIMSSGTLTDKVSALTLAIQESPLHNVRTFDALMTLASKKSRAQAIGAIGALVDLLGPGTILPPNRRLRSFHAQPGLLATLHQTSTKYWSSGQPLPGKITEAHLISWVYEDWLKETYFKIIQLLEVWCSDEIEYSRTRALDFVYALLKEKPEQESNLLRLLVNKLGDRDRKISSRASYLLLQIQNLHPGMKPVIVRTIEQEIILHPSQDHRSKYYAINTLNQTILSSKEPTVAESLVRIYFGLFVILLKSGSLGIGEGAASDNSKNWGKPKAKNNTKPQKMTSSEQATEAADKLVSAILTGVNRAAPFVGANDAIMESHLDTLFKIAHSANFNTGIQSLLLIQHLSSSKQMATDRFYRILYESLLDPRLVTSSKQALYLNLLLRSLKSDVDVRRVKAFCKRMLQIAALHQPPFVCGLLYVITKLRETFPDISTLVQDPEESIFNDEDAGERTVYDGRKRDPEYSNAHRSCLWELTPTLAHFHPSVTVLANQVLAGDKKIPKPDMDSHSLIRFLDKFVYRNAKSTDSGARGVSIMQPLRATKDLGDMWLGSRSAVSAAAPSVNSSAFWNKKAEDVSAEDAFFHSYFQYVAKEPKKPSQPTAQAAEEDPEDEIWQALVSAQPDIDDDASDVGFDDLDEEDMASEGDSPALSLEGDSDDDFAEEALGDESADEDGALDDLIGLDEDDEGGEEGEEEAEEEDAKARNKSRRKMLKGLPTFASVDDYAEMLQEEEEM